MTTREQTESKQPQAARQSAPAAFVVEVVAGPDVSARALVDAALESPLLVGQGPAAGLRLTDPQVSRRHLSLELEDGTLRVIDLGSTNGTVFQGVRVRDVSLRGGERLALGSTILAVTAVDHGRPPVKSDAESFGRILGRSRAMQRLYPLLHRVAASHVPCVIEGETGTGKEVLAESLHDAGPRANGPFVVFDCTAVSPDLIESALFGHERGAFTGAVQQRKGVFEQAHGGTLLVDEIGDLELPLQAKLLRAIERAEVQRVGGDKWIKVDVRVLAATRRDLDREVQAGRFRDDLFYRLAVARVELPALRKRSGDVTWLAERMWRTQAGDRPMPEALRHQLVAYEWPGNVRELVNAVARHAALGDLAIDPAPASEPSPRSVTASLLTAGGRESGGDESHALDAEAAQVIAAALPLTEARRRVVERFERRYLAAMLDRHDGNVRAAAAAAGIARRWFQIIRARQRGE